MNVFSRQTCVSVRVSDSTHALAPAGSGDQLQLELSQQRMLGYWGAKAALSCCDSSATTGACSGSPATFAFSPQSKFVGYSGQSVCEYNSRPGHCSTKSTRARTCVGQHLLTTPAASHNDNERMSARTHTRTAQKRFVAPLCLQRLSVPLPPLVVTPFAGSNRIPHVCKQ